MRNVLIPTDFSLTSLELVEKTAQCLAGESLHITLFHAFDIPFFVTDMVRPSALPYHDLLTEPFRQACRRLKHQFPKTIRSIAIRHLYGNSNAVFRNFADANDIDLIVCPDYYVFRAVHPQSVNPESMFRKARVPLLKTFIPRRPAGIATKENHIPVVNPSSYAAKKEHSV